MVQAYNFLASWQLFPEKCDFQNGIIPKSGNYKIDSVQQGKHLGITNNWVSVTNDAFHTEYTTIPDGVLHPYEGHEFADGIQSTITNASSFVTVFSKAGEEVLEIIHEILPNGYLKITQKGTTEAKLPFTNVEIYHKQLSVLPYASSAAGVAIRPTKEGVIKHKALTAMEEQTNMHLDQIKQQIELLARQAQEIQKRRELSLMIYEAALRFKPQIGQVYHLYEDHDGSNALSLISPTDWGGSGRFKQFVASVRLLADHTWVEV
jgi:hypothetical protein